MDTLHRWVLDVYTEGTAQLDNLANGKGRGNSQKFSELIFGFPVEDRPLLASHEDLMRLMRLLAEIAWSDFGGTDVLYQWALHDLVAESYPDSWDFS